MKTLALYTTLALASLALTACDVMVTPAPFGYYQPTRSCPPVGFYSNNCYVPRPAYYPRYSGYGGSCYAPNYYVRPSGCGYSVWRQPVINFGSGGNCHRGSHHYRHR